MCLTEVSTETFKPQKKYYCIVVQSLGDDAYWSVYQTRINLGGWDTKKWYHANNVPILEGEFRNERVKYISGFHLFVSKRDAIKYFKFFMRRPNEFDDDWYRLAYCSVADIRTYGYEEFKMRKGTKTKTYSFRVIVAD